MSCALHVHDLRYAYPGGAPALDGVGFHLNHGERLAVVGPNGAGKSTLLLALAGLLDGASGDIEVGHVPLSKSNIPEIRRKVGLVFQDPDDQLFMPTVFEDVAFGPLNQDLPEAEVRARVAEALATAGIAGYEDRAPHHLSGGEKRAVAIAGILACKPEVLVLDEPTAGLDPRARRKLIDFLAAFRGAMLLATHDLDAVLALCPETLLLDRGKVAALGETRAILGDEALLLAHGLEVPAALRRA